MLLRNVLHHIFTLFDFAVVEITGVSVAGQLEVDVELDRATALTQFINAFNANNTINAATFNGVNGYIQRNVTNASLATANLSYIFKILLLDSYFDFYSMIIDRL